MSKTDKCEITKVTIKIGGKDHAVTIDQAKALKLALEELFGRSMVKEHHHHYERYWWNQPTYTVEPAYPTPSFFSYEVTCDTAQNAACLSIS